MSSQTQVSKPVSIDKLLDDVKSLKKLCDSMNSCNLEQMQEACAEWWSKSSEFFSLHSLYQRSEDDENKSISELIWKSQIMLVATVGLIAATTVATPSNAKEHTQAL
jgi:hypothetical protein